MRTKDLTKMFEPDSGWVPSSALHSRLNADKNGVFVLPGDADGPVTAALVSYRSRLKRGQPGNFFINAEAARGIVALEREKGSAIKKAYIVLAEDISGPLRHVADLTAIAFESIANSDEGYYSAKPERPACWLVNEEFNFIVKRDSQQSAEQDPLAGRV